MFFEASNKQTIFDPEDKKRSIGLVKYDKTILELEYEEFRISKKYEYKPNLISFDKYGSAQYSWVIDVMNHFEHGFREYKVSTIIKVPLKSELRAIGILWLIINNK